MTRLEIMTDLEHLLKNCKGMTPTQPRLVWQNDQLKIIENLRTFEGEELICELNSIQLQLGLTSTEWTEIVSDIQQFLKGKE